MPPLHVVLIAPEIPQNTGNVGRTCVALGLRLHLVHPLGFILSDRHLRRAGLDYWPHLDLVVHESWRRFATAVDPERCHLFEPRGGTLYTEVEYRPGDYLVFGSERSGLPEDLVQMWPHRLRSIPMRPGYRSLNLATAVGIVAYEAMRQLGFPGLEPRPGATSRPAEEGRWT